MIILLIMNYLLLMLMVIVKWIHENKLNLESNVNQQMAMPDILIPKLMKFSMKT